MKTSCVVQYTRARREFLRATADFDHCRLSAVIAAVNIARSRCANSHACGTAGAAGFIHAAKTFGRHATIRDALLREADRELVGVLRAERAHPAALAEARAEIREARRNLLRVRDHGGGAYELTLLGARVRAIRSALCSPASGVHLCRCERRIAAASRRARMAWSCRTMGERRIDAAIAAHFHRAADDYGLAA